MRLSLFIIITCLLAAEIPINTHNNTYAKQARKETADKRVVVEVTLTLEGKTVPGKPGVVPAENTFAALYENAKEKYMVL